MTDPYTTFDTFSIGSEPDTMPAEPSRVAPIIARLPRVEVAQPSSATHQRLDEAASPLPECHLIDTTMTSDTPIAAYSTTLLALGDDPVATIRFDTVGPGSSRDEANAETKASVDSPAVASAASSGSVDEPWTAWMIDLESTIQPYARWIALAAVIAAMGLAIVLLRGRGGSVEATETAPQVQVQTTANEMLAKQEASSELPPTWPPARTEQAVDEMVLADATSEPNEDLRPLQESYVTTTPPASAAGPASAARAAGQARLHGEVEPVETSRIDVADATYNSTYNSTYPGTRR